MVVSVKEYSIESASDWQPDFSGEWGARVWFPDIMKAGLARYVDVFLIFS